jgi:hypothetical protein
VPEDVDDASMEVSVFGPDTVVALSVVVVSEVWFPPQPIAKARRAPRLKDIVIFFIISILDEKIKAKKACPVMMGTINKGRTSSVLL